MNLGPDSVQLSAVICRGKICRSISGSFGCGSITPTYEGVALSDRIGESGIGGKIGNSALLYVENVRLILGKNASVNYRSVGGVPILVPSVGHFVKGNVNGKLGATVECMLFNGLDCVGKNDRGKTLAISERLLANEGYGRRDKDFLNLCRYR